MGAEGVVQKEAPPPCVPDEKKPSLSVEELEAKQGTTTQIPAGMGGAWWAGHGGRGPPYPGFHHCLPVSSSSQKQGWVELQHADDVITCRRCEDV